MKNNFGNCVRMNQLRKPNTNRSSEDWGTSSAWTPVQRLLTKSWISGARHVGWSSYGLGQGPPKPINWWASFIVTKQAKKEWSEDFHAPQSFEIVSNVFAPRNNRLMWNPRHPGIYINYGARTIEDSFIHTRSRGRSLVLCISSTINIIRRT